MSRRLYRQGRCDAMAIALHRVTGLPLVTLSGQIRDGKGGWCNEPAHVAVRLGGKRWLDVDGIHDGIPERRLVFLRKPDRIRMLPTTEQTVRTLYTRSGVPEAQVLEAMNFIARDQILRDAISKFTEYSP